MSLLPALLGALVILYLVQVPLAYSLARRLRARQREREALLRRAIDASDLERRRIAADLHDSTVQRLAGVSLSLLVGIYPPTLQRSGLSAALDDLVAPLRAAGVAVSMALPGDLDLPGDAEALQYRVAQEALRNARSHGEASMVDVTVEAPGRTAVLCVVDNGRGFCPEETDQSRDNEHFGLRLMRDLADHAGGTLTVLSSPGHGTLVRLEVPLR